MKNKFLIIDGSNLLFQMFYGMPSRIVNSEGLPIQGVLGFIGALRKIINEIQPSHIVIIFDGECENERNNLDSEYKANRPDFSEIPEEDAPFFQLHFVYKCLDFLNIKYYETEQGEADDIIASYALKYKNDYEIVISSFDSDFFQLVCENVSVYRYRGKNSYFCDEKYIKDKYGILPSQYADFKSLVGDKADNIKGIEKIGCKTAAKLLNEFGSLENIISGVNAIDKKSVRESITRNIDRLRINIKLIGLNYSSILPFKNEELQFKPFDKKTVEILNDVGIL